ncbi:GTP-binding protein [Janibacter sp. FSL W8-0316]|uniref:sulfate adenylyltransferase subunit 1 n=1 Tax=Janibacter sp. FSL W8-0316 TaxID=2975325 RepID=UPI0030FC1356
MSTDTLTTPPAETTAVSTELDLGLLRVTTAGSVDDGKSTLIGRLLLDSKAIFEDQLEAVEATSKAKGHDHTDLALLTDGLRSEREQGITIDVAYRYFATPRRKFILADTPGHAQYTRNMVTGASTADLGLVLVDARHGITEQSRRHTVLLSLLRVPHITLVVNKMDLVGYDEAVFTAIRDEFVAFTERLEVPEISAFPISALVGDNVVETSDAMPWYTGTSLLDHLESAQNADLFETKGDRFPVQYVIRPQQGEHRDYRGYAGRVESGSLAVGQEVVVLPSGVRSTVAGIDTLEATHEHAVSGQSVVVRLTDEIDVSRGDVIADVEHSPTVTKEVTATVCWMTTGTLHGRQKLLLKHTTRTSKVIVDAIGAKLDVNTLERDGEASELSLNEVGTVSLRLAQPLVVDAYTDHRTTGSFILIDPASGATVGAGLISGTHGVEYSI